MIKMAKISKQPRSSGKSPRLTRSQKKECVKGREKRTAVCNTTLDMINRYSRQFLKVDDDISFKNSPSFDRQSRKEIFCSSMALENQNSVDCYEFDDQDDDIRLRLDLSPIKSEKTPSSTVRKRTSGPNSNKRSRSKNSNKENNSANKKRKIDTVKVKNAKNKKVTPKSGGKITQSKSAAKLKRGGSPKDSGIFMTPPSTCDNSVSTMPTSTPAITPALVKPPKSKSKKKPLNSKNTGEDSPVCSSLPDSPMLSPVKRIVSPNSEDMGALIVSQSEMFESMYNVSPRLQTSIIEDSDEPLEVYKSLDISKTYSGLGFGSGYFDKPIEKKKRSAKKAKRESVSHYDVIASQMNQEFDDLDDFEFSMD